MSSSEESDNEDIPEVEVCQHLCEQFAEITGTDTACAQFYLQDRKWNLDQSVNDFFEDRNNKGAVRVNSKNEAEVVLVVDGSERGLAAAATAVLAESASAAMKRKSDSMQNPSLTAALKRLSGASNQGSSQITEDKSSSILKFITWNIDGLNEKNIKLRTKAVCKSILDEQADMVFLQEVVPETAESLLKNLSGYECFFGNEVGYFVATLLKKSTVSHSDLEIIDFPNTRMMRHALKINATFKGHTFCLYNSHLESTAEGAEERVEQLRTMFKKVSSTNEKHSVIFGGDLNLRDKEVVAIGGLPSGIEDLWISCGKRKECAYTFDLTRNDNLLFNGKFKPRCRFDRVYFRPSSPRKAKPKYFGLIGLERLLPHRCFPSDHWGILSHFKIE
ncbi:tyrosyl-DNA phosphodiesterase 2 [Parasteatoda tepidariorum]|uniref:tyrosyl-DNA phosphodiesterase 2 n=1 Tax=Parasteatoda tepidariorum TaxID=114398 RepID=UPI00077FD128|nr:tyrosyl-DNA phosphodiesterase 2 [Parasteatoda tepidariorum]XP_042901700.1 tyrosyl-DNA phosphodiesterase 2 [Parasteatoda tepidariorum]